MHLVLPSKPWSSLVLWTKTQELVSTLDHTILTLHSTSYSIRSFKNIMAIQQLININPIWHQKVSKMLNSPKKTLLWLTPQESESEETWLVIHLDQVLQKHKEMKSWPRSHLHVKPSRVIWREHSTHLMVWAPKTNKNLLMTISFSSKFKKIKTLTNFILFFYNREGDRFLKACNLNRDWPSGRGIFHNDAKTFLVWVNEED